MSIDIAVLGTTQSDIVQQYWHKHQLCIEIFKIVYNTAWALGASMTEQCNTQFFNVTNTQGWKFPVQK